MLLTLRSLFESVQTNSEVGSNLRPRFASYSPPWLRILSPAAPYRGVLAGTGVLSVVGTSTLTGIGAPPGSADLVFGAAATLTGKGALSGTASLAFTANTGPTIVHIVGQADLTLGPEIGVFDPNVFDSNVFDAIRVKLTGTGALAGSASLTFGGTFFGSTLNPIVGIGQAVFQQNATPRLIGYYPISGAAALTSAATALGIRTGNGFVGKRLLTRPSMYYNEWASVIQRKFAQSQPQPALAALTFGGSGLLVAAGALTGSSTLAFGGISTLGGTANLATTTPLVFGATALVSGGALVGTAALSFGAVLFSGLASSTPITVGASGTLVGTGNLQGSSLLSLGVTGLASGTGMFGLASLIFSGSLGQSFRGIGQPLRAGYVVLYPSTSSITEMSPRNPFASKLVGVTSLTMVGSAQLMGQTTLVGAAALVFGGNGNAAGAILATSSILMSALATPRASGALVGNSDLSFGGDGSLVNGAPPAAVVQLVFSATGTLRNRGSWIKTPAVDGTWTKTPAIPDDWVKETSVDGSWIKKTGT